MTRSPLAVFKAERFRLRVHVLANDRNVGFEVRGLYRMVIEKALVTLFRDLDQRRILGSHAFLSCGNIVAKSTVVFPGIGVENGGDGEIVPFQPDRGIAQCPEPSLIDLERCFPAAGERIGLKP